MAVDAIGVALAGEAGEGLPQLGQIFGNVHGSVPAGPHAEHRAHDLGNDVPGLADDDGVSGTHVLQADLVFVVQAGEPDHRAGDAHRLQLCERSRSPCPPDRDEDVVQQGGLFLGRELVSDGPPGRVRRGPEPRVKGQLLDLHDDPVDLVAERWRASEVPAVLEHRL